MKVTLLPDGRLDKVWLASVHAAIPPTAIDIPDSIVRELAQYRDSKKYDSVTKMLSDITPAFSLQNAQQAKRIEVRNAFQTAAALPFADINGITWDGGYDSALRMDAAKRMAQLNGAANVTFYDINNAAHVLTIADAESVVLAIGADYQTKFAAKQALMLQVDAAASQADLDAIAVNF